MLQSPNPVAVFSSPMQLPFESTKATPLLSEWKTTSRIDREACSDRLLDLGEGRRRSSFFFSIGQRLGLETHEESQKVGIFMLSAFLGNSFFVIGRNVGTALFLANIGKQYMASAFLWSGISSLFFGHIFSTCSKGRTPARVNSIFLAFSAVILLVFYASAVLEQEMQHNLEGKTRRIVTLVIFWGIYIIEDTLATYVAMQCASVAQAAFTVTDAKRLFGLVQLGNSAAAMFVGITIGRLAQALGTEQMLAVQVVVLSMSWLLNLHICRHYSGGRQFKKKRRSINASGSCQQSDTWLKNPLILSMGLWGFTVILTKTMYEYEYNILVSEGYGSSQSMVAVTGYLYAAAGVISTAINLTGTQVCLGKFGMRGAILATPAALMSVSLAILVSPSVKTTFLGRMVDLSLRWSLNNTVRTVLWIAVPLHQATTAKPWVEGTVKKMGQVVNAGVIQIVMALPGAGLGSLSWLSLSFSSVLFVCCIRVYTLYIDSMWNRIKRRELQGEALPFDANIDRQVMERFMNGGTVTQIAMLNQMAVNFTAGHWEDFFVRFHTFPTTVQVKILDLSRKHRIKASDKFLHGTLSCQHLEASVLQLVVEAAGDRRLPGSLEYLQGFLTHPRPQLRAAAAVAIINIGWGIGLGETSTMAFMLLESMLGESLSGTVPIDHTSNTLRAAQGILQNRGIEMSMDPGGLPQLEETLEELKKEWEAALHSGKVAHAVVLSIQVTQVHAALIELTRRGGSCSIQGSSERGSQGSESEEPVVKVFTGSTPWQKLDESPERCEEVAAALQMIHQLPDPRAILPFDVWSGFLLHGCSKVRIAALSMVREDDHETRTRQLSIIKILVQNLQEAETYVAAESALSKLQIPVRIQDEVLDEFGRRLEVHKKIALNRPRLQMDQRSGIYMRTSVCMLHLLRYLQRQCSRLSKTDLADLDKTTVCDRLLDFSAEIFDADVLVDILMTMSDLKDRGFNITRSIAVARIYLVAEKLCQGIAIQEWLKAFNANFSECQLQVLRAYCTLPVSGCSGTWWSSEPEAETQISGDELAKSVVKIGSDYVAEHIYLLRLQLLYLSILVSPPVPASYRATRVLAAFRLLRSGDATSVTAVLEVLDSMLPPAVKGIVLPLLDNSQIDKKLSVINLIPNSGAAKVAWNRSFAPPQWAAEWFHSSLSLFGAQVFEMLAQTARQQQNQPIPRQVSENILLPKMLLLSRVTLYTGLLSMHLAEMALCTTVRQCPQGIVRCEKGETYIIAEGTFCSPHTGQVLKQGEVIQEWHSICKELPEQEISCESQGGVVICISWQSLFELMVRLTPKFALGILRNLVRALPAPESKGGCSISRSAVLCQFRQRCGTAFAIDKPEAKKVNGAVPTASEPSSNVKVAKDDKRPKNLISEDIAELARMHDHAEESDSPSHSERRSNESEQTGDEQKRIVGEEGLLTAASKNYLQRESFSLLEKIVLLQEVKIFRYVPVEHLPDIARCCVPVYKEKGEFICQEGEPTDATLYIIGDGSISLHMQDLQTDAFLSPGGKPSKVAVGKFSHVGLRTLQTADTMGNTALLLDTRWPYSAEVQEDCWLLCVSRTNLTDALRGRRDLASAVIHGLYKTFTRRIKTAVFADNIQTMKSMGDSAR